MIVSTALLRVCLSVSPRWSILCYMWLPLVFPCFVPHILPFLTTPALWSVPSLLRLCFSLRRQKHGAFLTRSDRSHTPFSDVHQPMPPFLLSLLPLLKQEVVLLFCVWCCLVSSHALCPVTGTLVGWLWSLGGLVSGVLTHLQSVSFAPSNPLPPLSSLFLPVWALSCPPTRYCGFVACIWSISTPQSSLSIPCNTVLHCMSPQTCPVGLSWFGFMFCCNDE